MEYSIKHISILFSLLITYSLIGQERKALLIGIDGVGTTEMQDCDCQNIKSIVNNGGIQTYSMYNQGVTLSAPSWATVLTGVRSEKHAVTNDGFVGSDLENYPYITNYINRIDPTIHTAQVVSWNPLDIEENNTGGRVYNHAYDYSIDAGESGEGSVTDFANSILSSDSVDFLFVNYNEVDAVGHIGGFQLSNPAYAQQLEEVDQQIGNLLTTIQNRSTFSSEEWMIIITSDHGGLGNSHGGNSRKERKVWMFLSSPEISNLKSIETNDPGTYEGGSNPPKPEVMKQAVLMEDIGVTLLHWLTETNPEEFNLDGKLITNIPTSINELSENKEVKIFQEGNRIRIENHSAQPVQANLYSLEGKLILTSKVFNTREIQLKNQCGILTVGTTKQTLCAY